MGCSLLPLQLRLELAGMAALRPVGLSGGLVKVETLGGLPASGQFPVGSWPAGASVAGIIIRVVAGEVLPPLDPVRFPFHLWLLFEPLISFLPHYGSTVGPISGRGVSCAIPSQESMCGN